MDLNGARKISNTGKDRTDWNFQKLVGGTRSTKEIVTDLMKEHLYDEGLSTPEQRRLAQEIVTNK